MSRAIGIVIGGIVASVALGCDPSRQSAGQLARVAKDWSLAVRASQVIPVYPLTEDVQVGDVFLVQTPYEDQVKVYEEKGFLPLENLVARLHPSGYKEFYSEGYGADDRTPRNWQFPPPPGSTADFSAAPRAAFPTYGFSVSRSEGLNVAVPVQSVPIGLNLLDAASANGTITIKDCYTYGRGISDIEPLLQAFVQEHLDFVTQFTRSNGQQFFLRVVNRVYLTRQVDVSLFANRAGGGEGSAGIPQPLQLANIAQSGTDAAKLYDTIDAVLNRNAAPTTKPANPNPAPANPGEPASQPAPLAGGTIKLRMASSRTVALSETFERPLVIGYIAFDLPIESDGSLGAPVATFAQLERRNVLRGTPVKWGVDATSDRIRKWLGDSQERRDQVNDYLKSRYGQNQPPPIRNVLNGAEYGALRKDLADHFHIP
jgi:hypothetical protein